MTIDEARTWLQRHADNTPMPGAREAYRTILEALRRTRWIPVAEERGLKSLHRTMQTIAEVEKMKMEGK